MQIISIRYAPLRRTPPSGSRLLYIPAGNVLEVIDTDDTVFYDGQLTTWYKVSYAGREGWTLSNSFDPYEYAYPENVVDFGDLQTSSVSDAEQYVLIDDRVKRNQCGEICVAMCLSRPYPQVIGKWEGTKYYNAIMAGSRDYGTREDALIDLFLKNGIEAQDTDKYFLDPVLETVYMSIQRLFLALKSNHIIAGVRIDRYTGQVESSGVWHWVVLDSIENGSGSNAMMVIYNPYSNRYEVISYAEFIISAGSWIGGVVVERRVPQIQKPESDSRDDSIIVKWASQKERDSVLDQLQTTIDSMRGS